MPSSSGRFWRSDSLDRFGLLDRAGGRVGFYELRDGWARRVAALRIPDSRAGDPILEKLGLAEERAPEDGRVPRAMGDGEGRLWALLGWSGDRQEWAVLDGAYASLVELVVLPGRFDLKVVRGRYLIGVQGPAGRNTLHVLRRGRSP